MKSILYLIPFILLASCSSDNVTQNPYLPNYEFNTGSLINTNLPQYSQLKFAGNSLILNSPYGINGVVLYYAGGENYNAFEITDPNHQLSTCSKLTVEGIIASCSCDDGNSYDLLNGIGREGTTGTYPLIRYRVEVSGSIIRIFNN
ncbi:hypothetical protein [Siansivirga zeaxanthinifaciens]|uniref:Rieske domain-containing protein n=1 Tax=Siansivirga zeaxanthinifaciens CC-SAMT-1 TaxID=1454006 RepID=A0A0C5WBC6_9FLAO|nr:hypothetical protein [Siansivirga zeaxanthinifaciens]AJR02664.1 hypothetical protein AW14_02385 [Siansivirga zeaxanthinifaciens CC-SAMT-1]